MLKKVMCFPQQVWLTFGVSYQRSQIKMQGKEGESGGVEGVITIYHRQRHHRRRDVVLYRIMPI